MELTRASLDPSTSRRARELAPWPDQSVVVGVTRMDNGLGSLLGNLRS